MFNRPGDVESLGNMKPHGVIGRYFGPFGYSRRCGNALPYKIYNMITVPQPDVHVIQTQHFYILKHRQLQHTSTATVPRRIWVTPARHVV